MKKTIICLTAAFALVLSTTLLANVPNPADDPSGGKAAEACYKKNGKLKKNRVIWNGRCYVKPDCGQGYYYGPSIGACMQDNGGGE